MDRIDMYLCRKCGYDLAGLGARGRCPECGNYFDVPRREGIRFVDDPASQQARYWGRVRTLVALGLGVMLLVCGGGLYAATHSERLLATLAFIASVAFLWALTSYLQEKHDPDPDA